jgi:ubiquinone/menaquinone biosynthesis C-methylase UbiE
MPSVVFDRAASFYDETRGFPPGVETPIAALIAHAANLTQASRALEIGVGTGRIGLPVSRHVEAFYGIDLAVPMLNQLRAKQKGEPIFVAQADATRLPFAQDTFDAVISVHVLHLIPNWQAAVMEIARVLRPGAPLLLCWNAGDDLPQVKKLWDAWNAAIPLERRTQVGAKADQDPLFLVDEGWRKHGSEQVHEFPVMFSPQRHLDRLRNRIWSRLWHLTDEELNAGVAAVEAATAELFSDPNVEIPHKGQFHVQAYLPPANL